MKPSNRSKLSYSCNINDLVRLKKIESEGILPQIKIKFVTLMISIFFICFSQASMKEKIPTNNDWPKESIYMFSRTNTFPKAVEESWKNALDEYKGKSNISYLEIGVFEGRSFLYMLDQILTGKNAKAVGIDIFNQDYEKKFLKNLKLSKHTKNVVLIKNKSEIALKKVKNTFDIIYIDGSHHSKNVMYDTILSWPLLKIGGLLIFDDYTSFVNRFPSDLHPKVVIDMFLNAFADEIEILNQGRQTIVRKKENLTSGCYSCTFMGRYRYEWYRRILYFDDKPVSLTTEQQSDLEQLIKEVPQNSVSIQNSRYDKPIEYVQGLTKENNK